MPDAGPDPSPPPLPLTDDQRKHLDFIQAVVARLSSSSSVIKGWGLAAVTATFGFAAAKTVPAVAALGMIVLGFFAWLDSYYLWEERKFRRLYDDARQGLVEVYSMNKNVYAAACPRLAVIKSWAIAWFYGPLLAVGVLAVLWSIIAPASR